MLQMPKSKIHGKQLCNNGPKLNNPFQTRGYGGDLQFQNANGNIDTSAAGFKFITDTLSYLRVEIIQQKFYEVPIAEYFTVSVGEGAWSDEIIQNLELQNAGEFFDGDMGSFSGDGNVASVDADLAQNRMPTQIWAKKTGWSLFDVQQAARSGNWNVIESKLKTLKKNWDLGIQEIGFLGHNMITAMTGLLNSAQVTINTTLIDKPLNTMTETEYTAFVAAILGIYYANSDSTQLPNCFIMPTDDYLGMGVPYSATFPNISKLEYLETTFKRMTGNQDFKIKPLAYCQAANNISRGINKNRYVLYNDNPEAMKMSIPVDFTMLEARTANPLFWTQPGYGQYSALLVNRPREIIYFDETA